MNNVLLTGHLFLPSEEDQGAQKEQRNFKFEFMAMQW